MQDVLEAKEREVQRLAEGQREVSDRISQKPTFEQVFNIYEPQFPIRDMEIRAPALVGTVMIRGTTWEGLRQCLVHSSLCITCSISETDLASCLGSGYLLP